MCAIWYWLSERSVQEDTTRSRSFFAFLDRAVGEVHKEAAKKERDLQYPPVRTEQAQSISYLLYGKSKNILRWHREFLRCLFRLNLFHVVLKHLLPDNKKKHLDSPHSQAYQTLKPFHKTESVLKRYKLKPLTGTCQKFPRQTWAVRTVSDRSGTNQNALFRLNHLQQKFQTIPYKSVTNRNTNRCVERVFKLRVRDGVMKLARISVLVVSTDKKLL